MSLSAISGVIERRILANYRIEPEVVWNAMAGGLVFPVVQKLARFEVTETADRISVDVCDASDGTVIHVAGCVTDEFPVDSVFKDLGTASEFFQGGALGYSADASGGRYYGIELGCESCSVETLAVERMESSFFDDVKHFPKGSVRIDCALLMRGIGHRWTNRGVLCCG